MWRSLNFLGFLLSGAARGRDAVAWGTSVPELCGWATQKRGSRGTPGMSLTTRSPTSSPSCLRSVSVEGHPSDFPPFKAQNHHTPLPESPSDTFTHNYWLNMTWSCGHAASLWKCCFLTFSVGISGQQITPVSPCCNQLRLAVLGPEEWSLQYWHVIHQQYSGQNSLTVRSAYLLGHWTVYQITSLTIQNPVYQQPPLNTQRHVWMETPPPAQTRDCLQTTVWKTFLPSRVESVFAPGLILHLSSSWEPTHNIQHLFTD